jgi:hypothetical protein
MQNAHTRFGVLEFVKRTKDTTTRVRVRLDRFVGESSDGGQAKAHVISVFGGDSELSAIWSGIVDAATFTVERPGREPVGAQLGQKAKCFRGAIAIPKRSHPVRHLVAVSEELALSGGADRDGKRTLLCDDDPSFVLYRLAKRFGLPVAPVWVPWFTERMKRTGVLTRLDGLGCSPVLVSGAKKLFMKWISEGLRRGELRIPEVDGPVVWPAFAKMGPPDLNEAMAGLPASPLSFSPGFIPEDGPARDTCATS